MSRLVKTSALLVVLLFVLVACGGGEQAAPKAEKKQVKAQAKAPKDVGGWIDGKWSKQFPGEVDVTLSEDEKTYLLSVARKTFEAYVNGQERYNPEDIPESLKGKKGNRVFATLYKDGEWRGCVSGKKNTLVDSVIQAVIATCKDKRFKNPQKDELDQFRVELSILQPKTLVDSKDLKVIKQNLEPGVHGIYLQNNKGKRAFFLPYVFVKTERTTKTWLERIARKGKMKQDAWRKPDTAIYKFNTINFMEDAPNGKLVDLYRYKVARKGLSEEDLDHAADLASHWVADNLKDGKPLWGLDDKHKEMDRETRTQTLLALAALSNEAESSRKMDRAKGNSAMWKHIQPWLGGKPGQAVMNDKGALHAKASFALALLLGRAAAVPKRAALAKNLASYFTAHLSDAEMKTALQDLDTRILAVVGLSYLSVFTKNEELYKAAQGLWPDLASKAKDHPGLLLAAAALTVHENAGQNERDAALKLALDGWMKKQFTKKTASYQDHLGAFDNESKLDTRKTAFGLWGLAILLQSKDWAPTERPALESTLVRGLRWLVEQQHNAVSSFYFPEWRKANGAFKKNILRNEATLLTTLPALESITGARRALGKELKAALDRNQEAMVY